MDEVQHYPDLFPRIKRAVDRARRSSRFLLTGSSAAEIVYWRTHSDSEVDFILSKGERLLPLEVKAASSLTPKNLRGLESFLADHGNAAPFGCVIYTGSEHRLLGPRILAISAMAP